MTLVARKTIEKISTKGQTAIHREYRGPEFTDDEEFWSTDGEHESTSEGTEIRVKIEEAVSKERLQEAGLSDDAASMVKSIDGPITEGDIIEFPDAGPSRDREWLVRDVTVYTLESNDPYLWAMGCVKYGG